MSGPAQKSWAKIGLAVSLWSLGTLVTAARSIDYVTEKVTERVVQETVRERLYDLKVLTLLQPQVGGESDNPPPDEDENPSGGNNGGDESAGDNPAGGEGSDPAPDSHDEGGGVVDEQDENGGAAQANNPEMLRWTFFFDPGDLRDGDCAAANFRDGLNFSFGYTSMPDALAEEQARLIVNSLAKCVGDAATTPVRLQIAGFASHISWDGCDAADSARLNLALAHRRRDKLHDLFAKAAKQSADQRAKRIVIAPRDDFRNVADMRHAFGGYRADIENHLKNAVIGDQSAPALRRQRETGPDEFTRAAIVSLTDGGLCSVAVERD